MQVIVYRLREAGRALTYAEIKACPLLAGRLVYGTWTDPAKHAKLIGDDGKARAELRNAVVHRVSSGCVLLLGFEPVRTPLERQAWLCAVDGASGDAALRKIRKPPDGQHMAPSHNNPQDQDP